MKKVVSLLLCLCLCLTVVLAGCGSKTETAPAAETKSEPAKQEAKKEEPKSAEKKPIKISAWGLENDPNSKIIKETVQLFNEKNTTNSVATIEFTEQEQYKTKITAQIAANEMPDMFNVWSAGFMKPFVTAGKIASISDELNKDADWKNRYVGGIFAPLTFDGKIYGAPTTQTVVLLYYNKEIFEKYGLKAPQTYAELKTVIETLNKNGVTPFALGNKGPWVGAMFSELVANRIGGSEPYNKVADGSGTWEDPSFIEAGKIMAELAKMNAFPKGFNALDNDPSRELFIQGKAAMHVMGSWAIQQVSNNNPNVGKLDVAKFPAMENGKGSVDNWLGQPDQCFVISSTCKNKEGAVEFLKFLSDPATQTKFAEAGNLIATTTKVDTAKLNPLAVKAAELQKDMKELFVFYDVGLGATVGNEYNNTIQAITAGKAPEEAFKKLQEFTKQNKDK
ncbi:MAG: extracellular solute-binding protein [Clostridia bacterium]|nr:extracellular solute-binding protein [Clostridia bacterium]